MGNDEAHIPAVWRK
jgi:hypothetical protein